MMYMLKVTIVASAFLFFACNPSRNITGENKLTREQRDQGWKLLFDGKTTKGWHKYGGDPVGTAWKVKDGYLYLDTSQKKNGSVAGGGDIVTSEEYDNFHFQTEWKIAKDGNSGIIFYIHEDKKKFNWPWETGPEMQILDNNGHPDAAFQKHRAGDLYDLISCSAEVVKPAGEWNLAEIKCINGKLDLYLNGVNVISTMLWDENWKKMVRESKFRNMPEFGIHKKGRIGLQDHDNEVCFRNIRIRRL
jgi:hypothetical protein